MTNNERIQRELDNIGKNSRLLATSTGDEIPSRLEIKAIILDTLSAMFPNFFSPEKDASFRTFAERCVRNRLYTAVRSAARSKHFPLNYSVSFDSSALSDLSGGAADYLRDPEDLIISRERVGEILDAAKNTLSGFEARVLELYLNGCSYNEIAEQVGKTPKSVDNAVQRIRKKLTAYY